MYKNPCVDSVVSTHRHSLLYVVFSLGFYCKTKELCPTDYRVIQGRMVALINHVVFFEFFIMPIRFHNYLG